MYVRQLVFVAMALSCFETSRALAADVVTLRCDFPTQGKIPAHFSEIIADQKGISVTDYITDKETGKLQYVKGYTSNSKEETKESYCRINSVEIAWGSTYKIAGTMAIFDSSIDLRTSVEKDDSKMIGGKDGMSEQPTQTGHCVPH